MHRPCTQRRVWHNLGLQKTQTERLNDKLPTMWQGVRVRCVYLKTAKPVKLVSLLPVRSPANFLETNFLALGQVQQRLRVESLHGFDPQGGPCKPKCASTRLYAHPAPRSNLILSDCAYSLQISKEKHGPSTGWFFRFFDLWFVRIDLSASRSLSVIAAAGSTFWYHSHILISWAGDSCEYLAGCGWLRWCICNSWTDTSRSSRSFCLLENSEVWHGSRTCHILAIYSGRFRPGRNVSSHMLVYIDLRWSETRSY